MLDSSLITGVDTIKYRSVHEKKLAEEILAKEGSWDPETQVFLTKQRQLQERTRVFNDMQQILRYSPNHSYVEQSENLDFVYPNAPAQLLKKHYTPHSQLHEVDPTPSNIDRKMKEQERVQHERKQKSVASQLSGTTTAFASQKEADEVMSQLERELRRTAESVVRSDSTVASTAGSVRPFRGAPLAGKSKAVNKEEVKRPSPRERADTSTAKPKTALPTLNTDGAGYSSLLVQLRKNKLQAQQHHKELSTVRSILTMEGSADLKRTITRMFADPKNAEQISKEEHERREKNFEEERKRTLQHQTSLLKEEREVMERELAQLQM